MKTGLKAAKRKTISILLIGLGLAWLGVRWGNSRATPKGIRTVSHSGLSDCPDNPNCVSSSSSRPESKILPIELREATSDAKRKLENVIKRMPGSQIVESTEYYLHAEFRSRILGFVDDLEILIDEQQRLIFMRSASRVGHSDLGVNRKRCEELRRLYTAR